MASLFRPMVIYKVVCVGKVVCADRYMILEVGRLVVLSFRTVSCHGH